MSRGVRATAAMIAAVALVLAAHAAARGAPAGGVQYDAAALAGARYLGPARLGVIGVDVQLQMRDANGLLGYAQAASDPRSPLYRHFLTPREIGDVFGAPASEQSQVAAYFARQGLAVRAWPQREIVHVAGTQTQIEAAFGTRLGVFQKGGQTFYGPIVPPRLPGLPVSAVWRLVSYDLLHRPLEIVAGPKRLVGGFTNANLSGYSPEQIAAAFDYIGAWNAGITGRGITIGIMGSGPIEAADGTVFRQLYGLGGSGTIQQVNVTTVAPGFSTGLQPAPPVTAPCSGPLPACNPEDVEAQLDTEESSTLAPDATVLYYLAYNPNECRRSGPCNHNPPTPAIGVDLIDDELQQAIADNRVDVISISAGEGEQDAVGGPFQADGTGLEPTEFATLAAEGISVFAASGDNGAEGCRRDAIPATADILCAVYPASDVNVTAVGGTTSAIGANGRLVGPLTAWGLQTALIGGSGATGGGISQFFARPGYQNGVATIVGAHRGVPDVAMNGDVITGVAVLLYADPKFSTNPGPLLFSVGGTSASAPAMAAMWALVLQACRLTPKCGFGPPAHAYRLGNANPLLYKIFATPKLYTSSIYDVVYGDNASTNTLNPNVLDPGFSAAPGYDLTTGIGVPFARNLITAITGQ